MFFRRLNKKERSPFGNRSCFFRRSSQKRGTEGIEQVVKWLLYIAIIVAAGFAIMRAVGKFA